MVAFKINDFKWLQVFPLVEEITNSFCGFFPLFDYHPSNFAYIVV